MIIEDLLTELEGGGPEAEQLAEVLGQQIYFAQRNTGITDAQHRVQQTWLVGEVPVTLDENGDGRDPIGDAYFDRINLASGLSATVNADEPRQIDITAAGGTGSGADCMFDYLVSTCFATLSGFTEGEIFTSISGCRFKGYTTIQGAVTDALTNPSGLGAGDPFTVAFDEVAAIYICGGRYIEVITTSVQQQLRFIGAGRGVTIVGGATSSSPTLGIAASCQMWVLGISWLCSSAGHAISVIGNSGAQLEIWDCAVNSASATRIGIEASSSHNWRQLSVHDCYFDGAAGGVGILTNAGNSSGTHQIWDCEFQLTTGVSCDENTEINNCLFVSCTTAVGIIDGSQGIRVKNCHFMGTGTTAVKLTGTFPAESVERLWIMDNTWGSDIAGITCFFDSSAFGGNASTVSDTWTIANNHGLSCSASFLKWTAGAWSQTQDWIIRVVNNSVKLAGTWDTGTRPGFLFSSGNWNGNAPVEGYVGRGMSSQLWYWIDDNDFQFGIIPFTCRFGDTPVYCGGGTFTITTAGTFQVELASTGTVSVTAAATPTPGRFPIVEFTTTMFGIHASYASQRNTAGIPYVGAPASGGTGPASNSEPYVTIGNTAGLTAERALTAGSNISIVDGGPNSTVTISTLAIKQMYISFGEIPGVPYSA